MFSRFDTIHACDGQTDGIGVAYTRYSIYAVARKNCHNFATGLPIDVMFGFRVVFRLRLDLYHRGLHTRTAQTDVARTLASARLSCNIL